MDIYRHGLLLVLGCDAIFALIAIPLASRKVPRNMLYGYRTRTTLSDDFLWYEANAHFGRGLLIAAAVSALAVLVLQKTQLAGGPLYPLAIVVVLAVPALIATISTNSYIAQLKNRSDTMHRTHK